MYANETPEKIARIIERRGPSLPIQIAKEVSMSSLFVSAFLSELSKEKRIKVSHLKVGGSPLYFLAGQEEKLEKFYEYMHPKEAEAFLLLKERKVLKDSEQEPAIRIALRSIRDFAIGFKKDEEIFWRFHSLNKDELEEMFEKTAKKETKKPDEGAIKEEAKEIKILKPKKQEIQQKEFLQEFKNYMSSKNIELVNMEKSDKKEAVAKIRFNLNPEQVHLLIAYNKKKISDKDLLKAYKKSLQHKLDYVVLFKGEISKKLKETIEAYKNLVKIEKFDLDNNI